MKNKYIIMFLFLGATLIWSCAEEDASLSAPTVPGAVDFGISIAPDSTGVVTFTPSAVNAFNFHFFPGDGTGPFVILPGESFEYAYAGLDSVQFVASIVAYGVGAGSSSNTELIEMFLKLQIEPAVMIALTGAEVNSSKRWIWDSNVGGVNGHFGVGPGPNLGGQAPGDYELPAFFAASENLLADCLYDDVLVFSVNADGVPSFSLETNGVSFVNGGQLQTFGVPNGDDTCLAIDDDLVLNTSWAVRPVDGGKDLLTFGGGIFTPMSYFANVPEYNIVELTPNKLRVQGFTADGILAWYFQFIPE